MNREEFVEVATKAAKEFAVVLFDELENHLHESVCELEERIRSKVEEVTKDEEQDENTGANKRVETHPQTPESSEDDEPVARSSLEQPDTQPAITVSEQRRDPRFRWYEIDDADLLHIEQRCRIKAEGARWAGERRRLQEKRADHYTEIAPRDREILEQFRGLPNCSPWMNRPDTPQPDDVSAWDAVADCFGTLAEAVGLVQAIMEQPVATTDVFKDAISLMAEAQSALRVAVAEFRDWPDPDQQKAFCWLRETASERQVFIERYMRIDDSADPQDATDLTQRIHVVRERFDELDRRERQRKKLLDKLRYVIGQIREGENLDQNWSAVLRTIEDLIADGLPPSNVEMREIVLPVLDEMPVPEIVPQGLRLFLRATDDYLATIEDADDSASYDIWSEDVQEVAERLAGRRVILIGGKQRPHVKKALIEAFRLEDLTWIETTGSYADLAPLVGQSDVAVVLLSRWVPHRLGNVKTFCDRYGKPLVRLPGGYNPNQVAAQIMEQASDRL